MVQKISAIDSNGRAVKVNRYKCGRIQCPNCYQKWISDMTFKYAVQFEAYAQITGERPCMVSASLHPSYYTDNDLTWKDYGNSFRRIYTRLKKLGVYAGLRIFHPFRINKSDVKALKDAGYGNNSGTGLWKGVRADALGYGSYRDYVHLAPHLHCMVFPGWLDENYDSEIIAKKYAYLENTESVVAQLKYTLSHTATSNDFDMDSCMPFGKLFSFKPEQYLKPKALKRIKHRVASAMGLEYDEEADDVIFSSDSEREHDDGYDWVPIKKFLCYSASTYDYVDEFLWHVNIFHPENHHVIHSVIELYNSRVFRDDLPPDDDSPPFVRLDDINIPDTLAVVYDDFDDFNE